MSVSVSPPSTPDSSSSSESLPSSPIRPRHVRFANARGASDLAAIPSADVQRYPSTPTSKAAFKSPGPPPLKRRASFRARSSHESRRGDNPLSLMSRLKEAEADEGSDPGFDEFIGISRSSMRRELKEVPDDAVRTYKPTILPSPSPARAASVHRVATKNEGGRPKRSPRKMSTSGVREPISQRVPMQAVYPSRPNDFAVESPLHTSSSEGEEEKALYKPTKLWVPPPRVHEAGSHHSGADVESGGEEIRFKGIRRYTRNQVHWTLKESCSLHEVGIRLDNWLNDFNPHHYAAVPWFVKQNWVGHPMNRPKDIRARSSFLTWNTANRLRPREVGDDMVVYRAILECNGTCVMSGDRHFDFQERYCVGEKDLVDDGVEKPAEDGDKKTVCACPARVKIHIEVLSRDLSVANIWQYKDHDIAPKGALVMSAHLRQLALTWASVCGLSASQIRKALMAHFVDHPAPAWRKPSARQLNWLVANVRRQERMASEPLVAIDVFRQHNPDRTYCYEYVPSNDPKKPPVFCVAIQHPYALQNLILHSQRRGVGLDSSYRNKNENRAPVTFLVTVDMSERMVPGPCMVSGDVKAVTLAKYLSETTELVVREACRVVQDPVGNIDDALSNHSPRLIAESKKIAETGEWYPLFCMIDKSRSEYDAIQQVWPKTFVRLCQFHVIQAILRMDVDPPGAVATGLPLPVKQADKARALPAVQKVSDRPKGLTKTQKDGILIAFRLVQRAADNDEFFTLKGRFVESLHDFVPNDAQRRSVEHYFEKYWFTEYWRVLWTDIGRPPGYNRDHMSTNNYTEAAFKTFDKVFLNARANKSMYRLVHILATQYYEYYRIWHPGLPMEAARRFDEDWCKAYDLYETAEITDGRDGKGRRTWTIRTFV